MKEYLKRYSCDCVVGYWDVVWFVEELGFDCLVVDVEGNGILYIFFIFNVIIFRKFFDWNEDFKRIFEKFIVYGVLVFERIMLENC